MLARRALPMVEPAAAFRAGSGAFGATAGRGGPAPPAVVGFSTRHRDDFLSGFCSPCGSASRSGFASGSGARRFPRARTAERRRIVDGQDHRADLHLVAALTLMSLTTPATEDGTSIVALSVSSSTTGCSTRNGVADLDEHPRDVALLDVLSQLGNFEFLHQEFAGFGFSY
jgi:hypothetical protein